MYAYVQHQRIGMLICSVAKARSRLAELIDAAMQGQDVVVTRNGVPVVRIQPYHHSLAPLQAMDGALKGRLAISASDTGAKPLGDH